jgi:hypothetical protein
MTNLLTKKDAMAFFGLATEGAAEKLLHRLGVPRIDFSLIGGKGIRYRKSDLEEALAKITVETKSSPKKKKPKQPPSDLWDLPVKEQMAILTAAGVRQ